MAGRGYHRKGNPWGNKAPGQFLVFGGPPEAWSLHDQALACKARLTRAAPQTMRSRIQRHILARHCCCCRARVSGQDVAADNLCRACRPHAMCGICRGVLEADETAVGLLCAGCLERLASDLTGRESRSGPTRLELIEVWLKQGDWHRRRCVRVRS